MNRQTHRLPAEILATIISHLIYDTPSLKACAMTCFAWYNEATLHLHHTLTLRQHHGEITRRRLNPLHELDKLDLLRFIKKIRFQSYTSHPFRVPWVTPAIFDSRGLHYCSALVGLQGLTIEDLDFALFGGGEIGKYFGHFPPTLRSITLKHPRGSHRRLLDFLALFPGLDDIEIVHYRAGPEENSKPNIPHSPIPGPLRGKLTLDDLAAEGLFGSLFIASGGARFISMDLNDVLEVQVLLEACAETLQTLRLYPDGLLQPGEGFRRGWHNI